MNKQLIRQIKIENEGTESYIWIIHPGWIWCPSVPKRGAETEAMKEGSKDMEARLKKAWRVSSWNLRIKKRKKQKEGSTFSRPPEKHDSTDPTYSKQGKHQDPHSWKHHGESREHHRPRARGYPVRWLKDQQDDTGLLSDYRGSQETVEIFLNSAKASN